MRKYLYIIALLTLLLCGCKKKVEMDLDMYNSNQVSLMVKGKKVFTFDEANGQLGYNRSLRQFRAGNDDMTSYFVLTCSELPRSEEQEIRATLQYSSGSSGKSMDITLKVEKYDDTGLVWLWNSVDKTGAVVKTLN
jgi:type III secretory pathway lipoprotein EscJ